MGFRWIRALLVVLAAVAALVGGFLAPAQADDPPDDCSSTEYSLVAGYARVHGDGVAPAWWDVPQAGPWARCHGVSGPSDGLVDYLQVQSITQITPVVEADTSPYLSNGFRLGGCYFVRSEPLATQDAQCAEVGGVVHVSPGGIDSAYRYIQLRPGACVSVAQRSDGICWFLHTGVEASPGYTDANVTVCQYGPAWSIWCPIDLDN